MEKVNIFTLLTTQPREFTAWLAYFRSCFITSKLKLIPPGSQIVLFHIHQLGDQKEMLTECIHNYPSVIVVSDHHRTEEGIELFRLGIKGYIPKTLSAVQLEQVLQTVKQNNIMIGHEVMSALIKGTQQSSPDLEQWKETLTSRELETAEAILQGLSNKQIAKKMSISERTVKSHVRNLFDKFNVNDRLALVLKISGKLPH